MRARLYLSVLMLLIILGCASQKSLYEKAQKDNTIQAYKSYLEKYQDSPYSDVVKKKLREMEYHEAIRLNTIESYLTFLGKYPPNKGETDVMIIQKKIIDLEIDNMVETESIEALEGIKRKYPYFSTIQRIDSKIKEQKYKAAINANTEEALRHFMIDYPGGQEIIKSLHDFEFKNAKEKNSLEAYRAFSKAYPKSPRTELVDSLIKELEFQDVKEKSEIKAFEDYLANKPDAEKADQIRALLADLTLKKAIEEKDYNYLINKYIEKPDNDLKSAIIRSLTSQKTRIYSDLEKNARRAFNGGKNAEKIKESVYHFAVSGDNYEKLAVIKTIFGENAKQIYKRASYSYHKGAYSGMLAGMASIFERLSDFAKGEKSVAAFQYELADATTSINLEKEELYSKAIILYKKAGMTTKANSMLTNPMIQFTPIPELDNN